MKNEDKRRTAAVLGHGAPAAAPAHKQFPSAHRLQKQHTNTHIQMTTNEQTTVQPQIQNHQNHSAPMPAQSKIENQNSKMNTALAFNPQPLVAPKPGEGSTLDLIASPLSSTQAVALIDAQPLTPPGPASGTPSLEPRAKIKHRRKGRVASLPKVQRDMVNRMLWNGV